MLHYTLKIFKKQNFLREKKITFLRMPFEKLLNCLFILSTLEMLKGFWEYVDVERS